MSNNVLVFSHQVTAKHVFHSCVFILLTEYLGIYLYNSKIIANWYLFMIYHVVHRILDQDVVNLTII